MGARSPKGSKVLAQQKWIAQGRPDPVVVMAKWSEYVQSSGELSTMHIARWFGLRGWEDEYAPAVGLRTVPTAPPAPGCWWHRQRGSRGKPSNKPEADCPECKHIAARNGTRSGEPASIAELMGGK
jgi:hypothetical protein